MTHERCKPHRFLHQWAVCSPETIVKGGWGGFSAAAYDFGDQPAARADGYGSMQIHNHDARQTLFAVNHWRNGEKADAGIGNRAESHPDWIFAANADTYAAGRLRVLVRLR